MQNFIRNQYNAISKIYDILSKDDDGILYFRLFLEKLLKELPANTSILDSCCGTGDHAIWLANQAYTVSASDISDGMIGVASNKAKDEHADINFFRSSWEELPEKTTKTFDMVLCPGNSFSHVQDFEMLYRSLKAIRKVLRPGGILFFDLRNWEKTYEENSLPPQEFQVEGIDYNFDVKYSWKLNAWNTASQMIVDLRKTEDKNYERFVFDFFPIGYYQIHDALLKTGFKNIVKEDFPDDDYYCVTAK